MRLRALLPAILLAASIPAAAAQGGRVNGVVVAQGTPQIGAAVFITPEARPGQSLRLLTDQHGLFRSSVLLPGPYSVRVRLPGFLPAFQPQVIVSAGQITLLRIELGSVFSSVERLREGPPGSGSADEWKWVLRSASVERPVLRFSHGRVVVAGESESAAHASHGRAEITAGSLAAWSPANPQPVDSTSFLYDHNFGPTSQLIVAGSVGYEHSTASAVAATWVRSSAADGSITQSTTVVFRQSEFGTEGPSFNGVEIRSMRVMKLSDRAELDYGGQFVLASMAGAASTARPQADLRITIDPAWTASLLVGSTPQPEDNSNPSEALADYPTPVENAGRLTLDQPWHEELALDHPMPGSGTLLAAVFHDSDANTALFGHGSLLDSNTVADPYSDAFVYDGGTLNQWGARVGYKENFSSHWQAALLYSWSRTLAPASVVLSADSLRGMISAERRNSLGTRISGRLQRTGTEFTADYEWVDGPILTRPDPFGAQLFGVNPYANLSLRQPLPNFLCCRIVAIVDVRNLLAQGYVSLETADGRAILLPAARSIRGGFAFQF